jgi:hypothetical protein
MSEQPEKPAIFCGSMVRAILEDRKTMTRRVIQPPPSGTENFPPNQFCDSWYFRDAYYACPENDIGRYVKCPYGVPGTRLWVRETWAAFNTGYYDRPEMGVFYRADGEQERIDRGRWRPSIHMPRWASRLTLEVCEVRVERLQSISAEDARAEGIREVTKDGQVKKYCVYDRGDMSSTPWAEMARDPVSAYRLLWDSINGKRSGCSWADNPWVWKVSFRRLDQ